MNIVTYIENIKFDKYQFYYRDNKYFETVFLDIGNTPILIDAIDGTELMNSIFTGGTINPSFTLIEDSQDLSFISDQIKNDSIKNLPNRKTTIFDSAIVLYHQNNIIDYFNISIEHKICRNSEDISIDLTVDFVEKFALRIQSFGTNPFKGYHSSSISVMDQWRHYRFPFDFYKNPIFEVFESSIYSGIFSTNWQQVKIVISPINGRIGINQLNKAKYLEENKSTTREILLKLFWEEYLKWKQDYELPELHNKEQLYSFVRLSSISIGNDVNLSAQMYFRTWDDEHGQNVRYIDKDKIEFE